MYIKSKKFQKGVFFMLNKAQQEAVETINGQLIMIACPGAGKTTTMVHRISNMVNNGVSPENIIMMTFTKSAAEEMEERYLKLEGAKKGVTFCTIHSLCYSIVREVGPKYVVMDEQDKWEYFMDKLKNSRKVDDLETFISDLLLDISRKKVNPTKVDIPIQCTRDRSYFEWLYGEYEKYKEARNLIDYDDMIILAKETLSQNSSILNKYQARFKYIQVDEYQDTSEIEKDVIYMIAGKNGNLAVVGDEDQCIYAFRGASPSIMLNFQKDFPKAKIIKMGINYRSTPDIINKADLLIRENKLRFEKEFVAAKKKRGNIRRKTFRTRLEEIEYITDEVSQMLDRGVDANEIAVLYRNNNQAEELGYEFFSEKIPFKVAGGMNSKFEHFIWKDICMFKRVSSGKGSYYDVERALKKPNRWLKLPSFDDFPDIDIEGHMLITFENEELFRMKVFERAYEEETWKIKAQAKAVSSFFDLMRALSKIEAPSSFMRKLWPSYRKYLENYADFRQIDFDMLQDRYYDYIDEAVKRGDEWNALFHYVNGYNATIKKNKESKKGVTLSTMHKAKGLEWDNVFIVDCVSGICPAEARHGISDIEEERRLFYVAVTRARDNLTLTNYTNERCKAVKESPFLIPFKDVEKKKSKKYR